MCTDARTPILLLVCLSISSVASAGERRASILENQPKHARSAEARDGSQLMQSPVLGFVYAADRGEVRAILGIPGASILSHASALPEGVTKVNFAPGQKYAIVEGTNGASIGLIAFPGADLGPLTQIPGGISQPDIVSFSANGTAAVVYSAPEGRLQVITGLPGTPQVAREMSSAELPDAVRLLAVADDGVTLLEGTVMSAVYLLSSGTAPQFLDTVGDLGGMAFVPGWRDALIFDRNGGALLLLRSPSSRLPANGLTGLDRKIALQGDAGTDDAPIVGRNEGGLSPPQSVSSSPSSRLLVNGLTGLDGNIVLQVDARRAIITSTNTNHLWQIDLQSLQAQEIQLPTTPAMLQPLRTSGTYLLSWQPGQPAWIVDTSEERGVVYFVPASIDAQSAQPPLPPSSVP